MAEREFPRPDVLVIDDDEAVRKLTCRVLQLDGHAVESAVDGVSGLAAHAVALGVGAHPVVILDLGLPDLSGCEVLASLLAQDPKARILVMSGSDVTELRDCPEMKGAVDFLQKPMTPADLQAVVRAQPRPAQQTPTETMTR